MQLDPFHIPHEPSVFHTDERTPNNEDEDLRSRVCGDFWCFGRGLWERVYDREGLSGESRRRRPREDLAFVMVNGAEEVK